MEEMTSPVILDRSAHPISRRDIDPDALKVLYRLSRHGFKAYLVGGAVRDLLLGKKPKDFDVATDARPGQVKKLFSNCFLVGRRFRLAHIRFRGNKIIEVATFRRDPDPEHDSPTDIHNTFGTPVQDALRRDITMNALFYDIETFSVIDFVGGLEDIANRRVRVIGDPPGRFSEDPVRMWRVLRHASRLGFAVDEHAARAIRDQRGLLAGCSGARLYEELNKDLSYGKARETFSLLMEYGLLSILLGAVGERLEQDASLAGAFLDLMGAHDRMLASGGKFEATVAYSLLLWPWACATLMSGPAPGTDRARLLAEEIERAGMIVTIPKGLCSSAVHVILAVNAMMRSLETGRLKTSLMGRSDYGTALRVFALVSGIPVSDGKDPFLELFRARYPGVRERRARKRRRRRRRRPQGNEPSDTA